MCLRQSNLANEDRWLPFGRRLVAIPWKTGLRRRTDRWRHCAMNYLLNDWLQVVRDVTSRRWKWRRRTTKTKLWGWKIKWKKLNWKSKSEFLFFCCCCCCRGVCVVKEFCTLTQQWEQDLYEPASENRSSDLMKISFKAKDFRWTAFNLKTIGRDSDQCSTSKWTIAERWKSKLREKLWTGEVKNYMK